MKSLIKQVPLVGKLAKVIYYGVWQKLVSFSGSQSYWDKRYLQGGNSGDGSYSELALFKAEVINSFVAEQGVNSVIEYGCGDGNQLGFATYPNYIGYDVSSAAVDLCEKRFGDDPDKKFALMSEYEGDTAELVLSLDVIYHLVEDDVFEFYMNRLFSSSVEYVVIYSSNTDQQSAFQANHVRHRKFSLWIEQVQPEWQLIKMIPNKYPASSANDAGSFADFYIYKKT